MAKAGIVEFLMLGFEPLCLSTQSVISLRLKTMLKHGVFRVFLLNSERLLSRVCTC